MNLRDWFRLQPDDEPRKGSGQTNERPLCCVYCDAYARIEFIKDRAYVVCVRNPRHVERV